MTKEVINNFEQKDLPEAFISEEIGPTPKLEFKIDDHVLKINNQDAESFKGKTVYGAKKMEYNNDIMEIWVGDDSGKGPKNIFYHINSLDMGLEYPVIYSNDDSHVFVNDVEWDTLRGKNVFQNTYRASFDTENKKTAFSTEDGMAVVNNVVWKNKVGNYLKAKDGHVGAMAQNNQKSYGYDSVIIDDKKWDMPLNDENSFITQYDFNKNSVAAVVDNVKNNKYVKSICTGDLHGKKNEWQNDFSKVEKIIVDKNTEDVAVIAKQEDEELMVVINDVKCKTKDQIKIIEDFKMEDGIVTIQYKNPLGELKAEKIHLQVDAKAIAEKNELEQKHNEDLRKLDQLLINSNLKPGEILEEVNKGKKLQEENERLKKQSEDYKKTINHLGDNIEQLKQEKELLNNNYEGQNRKLENNLKDKDRTISDLKSIFSKMTKKTFGGYDLSKEDYEKLKNIFK